MKYNNKKVEYDGFLFDSILEKRYYIYLKELKEKGSIKDFENQPEFILQEKFKKNNKTIREIKYIADFKVYKNDGSVEIIDTKGMITDIAKLKKKLFDYKYPELDLYFVKYVKKFGGWITEEEYKKKKREEKKK